MGVHSTVSETHATATGSAPGLRPGIAIIMDGAQHEYLWSDRWWKSGHGLCIHSFIRGLLRRGRVYGGNRVDVSLKSKACLRPWKLTFL
jgi:hypothetical protein